jgi:cellobiose phosphorylase
MNITDLLGVELSSRIPTISQKKYSQRVLKNQVATREEISRLGMTLAADHKIKTALTNDRRLYLRLRSNCADIEKSYLILADTARKKEAITPGTEWLLDNYHVIEKQINEIKNHFPRGYDKTLPRLLEGEYRQYPRVYHLAMEFIANTDCVLDTELLNAYVEGYQTQAVLHIGEVWAVPIMIRFALLEQLRNLSLSMIRAREEFKAAENLIEEILGDESKPGTQILLNLAEKVMLRPDFLTMGAGHLIRRLRDRGRIASLTLQWLEERLREEGQDPEEILKNEQRLQAADQITIGNIFTSLRSIAYVDWEGWFEHNCKIEHILRLDPAGIYPRCDFKTRDAYRHRIERLARYAKKDETDVAVAAIGLARDYLHAHKDADEKEIIQDYRASVGGYLSQRGLPLLEQSLQYRPGIAQSLPRFIKSHPIAFYFSLMAFFTAIPYLYALCYAQTFALFNWEVILVALLCFIPASDLGNNITQWLVTKFTSPKLLPKLNFENGIPEECKTTVVVHSLFSDRTTAKNTIESLHVRYLGNDDPNLIYCVLADLSDADTEIAEKDQVILEYAQAKIADLRAQHGHDRFMVLFRRRHWNPSEGKWMAWERKRGKVEEFNLLLLGAVNTSFIISEEERRLLLGTKYVITLDNDTQLPRGTAQKLVAAASHPMNAPVFNPRTNRVIDGYTIIQPRVGVSLTSANTSSFAKIFSGNAGLDPYTQTVSDVYQDLFSEGSYIGKGIYRVDAFEKAMHNRVPTNALLSHDLFEGIFARVALASDIELYDEFPSKYHVHAKRQHRWIRGDWQLLPWVGVRSPAREGKAPSRVTPLGWWKLFDNLRRSLVAPSLFALIAFGSVVLPGNPLFWIAFAALVIAFPVYTNLAQALIIPPQGLSYESHFGGIWRDFAKMFKQTLLTLIFMPHQAFNSAHAITITLLRLYVSKKHLLQWETAYHAERRMTSSLLSFLHEMMWSIFFTTASFTWVVVVAPERLPLVIPLYILWFSAPFAAKEISRPRTDSIAKLSESEKETITSYAHATWTYFHRYLTAENNYLIPDNFQEVPSPVVAQRTSPTNISLSMLTTISAYDLGFISSYRAANLVNNIFKGLAKLERYNGHFLNWYKTDTAESLYPRYVSMVDSGNMAGHLIAVKNALIELKKTPVFSLQHVRHIIVSAKKIESKLGENSKSAIRNLSSLLSAPDGLHSDGISQVQNALEILHQTLPSGNEEALSMLRDELSDFLETLKISQHDVYIVLDEGIKACSDIIESIDFSFLYDSSKDLFAIGYNVDAARRDTSYYDLLASEARLGSLCAIAMGQLPERHWFSLGRGLTQVSGGKALLSWTGTMFEYLMPLLVMRSYPDTLLHETYDVVVKAQKNYATKNLIPWGISESSFSGVDFEKTYQYRAFGVPGLGLKRGLEDDLVISPYSTMLALPIDPKAAMKNLDHMKSLGFTGDCGFYEAVDYTKERLAANEKFHIVRSYFAHHQGMSMVAMNNTLHDHIWQRRFHRDPLIQSVDLLLQEKFPERLPVILPHQTAATGIEERKAADTEATMQLFTTPHTAVPRTHLLSNGRYTVMVDNSGGGFSLYDKEISLTRWREDTVQNDMGTHIYIRDLDTSKVWSAGYQPTFIEPKLYEAIFTPDKAEFKRRDENIYSHLEITVSPEDDLEIRRITVANTGTERRTLELTSFAEVALAPTRADQAHPAFAKMFIQSEYLEEYDALLFSRRPRSKKEEKTYLLHQVVMHTVWDRTRYESSREVFIGRGNNYRNPHAMQPNVQLSGTTGYVLDPCMSLRVKVELAPGESQTITYLTGFSRDRDAILQLANRYRDFNQINRAFEVAWSQASIELRNEQAYGQHGPVFQRLANGLLLNIEKLRAKPDVISRNRLGQSGLWRFGISGDLPICLVKITEQNQTKIVEELLQAHHYLRNRGFQFDLVILNEHSGGYLQSAQDEIEFLIRSSFSAPLIDRKGGIFTRNITQLSEEERDLLQSVARVVLSGLRGSLAAQMRFEEPTQEYIPFESKRTPNYVLSSTKKVHHEGEFFNGVGSFDEDGKSYSFSINDKTLPPAPWSNVVANPRFGTVITEVGGGYTWSENSRENRLTPWSNDPVIDPLGEVIYFRDVKSGAFWCPTPRPISLESDVSVHHRFGETEFLTTIEGITSTLSISVSPDDNIKFWNLDLENVTPAPRTIEVYLYANWVMGVQRQDSYMQLVSSFDKDNETLYVQNHYNADFGRKVLFLGSSAPIDTYTTQRAEFIGRNRDLSSPIALASVSNTQKGGAKSIVKLSGRTGACHDSCGVIKVIVQIEPNQTERVSLFLGDADSVELMKLKAEKAKDESFAREEALRTKALYKDVTTSVQIKTPLRSFDILVNGWLLYQTIGCRLWGRTGFYQSGGAFGFRDQLQDSMALLYSRPDLVRSQILLHASRQFAEGDVQHWWHPPTGKGVRTRISDDYLWMPLITQKYIEVTGDTSILDERAGFIDGPILAEHEMEAYIVPHVSQHTATIYEKCILMIDRSLTLIGERGMPLMGCGDWNDGMNEIGHHGKGESVWMGWFLATVIKHFIPSVEKRGDSKRVARYEAAISSLKNALETNAWDGDWYRRAYFDDGSPVGSKLSEECQIDSLPQSWSIISGIGDEGRSKVAMDNVYDRLVSDEFKIIKLFTPPFNTGPQEPGYIKGYLPGIRENGGQYTHASAWVIIATALMGRGSKAVELFELINPLNHTKDVAGTAKYRCEPYVLCGDVYSAAPYEGRAGWSWYTGSAGWMYQAAIEYIFGLKVTKDFFTVEPCIPNDWKELSLTYRRGNSVYQVSILNPQGVERGVKSVSIDGSVVSDGKVIFTQDGKTHQITVTLG